MDIKMKRALLFWATVVAAITIVVMAASDAKSARVSTDAVDQIIARFDVTNGDGGVASSGVLTSVKYCNQAAVYVYNHDATIDRQLDVDWVASDGTTVLYRVPIWVQHAAKAAVLIDSRASSVTAASGETVIPMALGDRMRFQLEADGGTNQIADVAGNCRP